MTTATKKKSETKKKVRTGVEVKTEEGATLGQIDDTFLAKLASLSEETRGLLFNALRPGDFSEGTKEGYPKARYVRPNTSRTVKEYTYPSGSKRFFPVNKWIHITEWLAETLSGTRHYGIWEVARTADEELPAGQYQEQTKRAWAEWSKLKEERKEALSEAEAIAAILSRVKAATGKSLIMGMDNLNVEQMAEKIMQNTKEGKITRWNMKAAENYFMSPQAIESGDTEVIN
jgi:hypothetical protein